MCVLIDPVKRPTGTRLRQIDFPGKLYLMGYRIVIDIHPIAKPAFGVTDLLGIGGWFEIMRQATYPS